MNALRTHGKECQMGRMKTPEHGPFDGPGLGAPLTVMLVIFGWMVGFFAAEAFFKSIS